MGLERLLGAPLPEEKLQLQGDQVPLHVGVKQGGAVKPSPEQCAGEEVGTLPLQDMDFARDLKERNSFPIVPQHLDRSIWN